MGLKDIQHVAMYLRISQEKKSENTETLTNHREILTDFANQNKYTFEEFGEVISGGKTEIADRVALQRLLNNIESFDAILVMELSRISRNGLISQTVKQYCIDYDVPIITPYGNYDLANSDTDRLMFDVGSMISSHEHGVIGKRSKANKLQMARSGLHVAGGVPFGYKRNKSTKKLEIDEEAAKTIRYIFQLHAKGLGSFKIRDTLNEEGFKSATGKFFNLPSVKRIIRNPHYKGWTVMHDRKRIKKAGKVGYEITDTIVVKDTHPAIIPPHEWDSANRERESRASQFAITREKPAIKSDITMLKDLVYCGVCGKKMTIRKDYKDSTGYTLKKCEYLLDTGEKCNNAGVKMNRVEDAMYKEIKDYRDVLANRLENLKQSGNETIIKERTDKEKRIQKRIKEVEDQDKKLINLALSGIFSNDEIRDKKQELLELKNSLEGQLEELLSEDLKVSKEEETNWISNVIFNLDHLSHNDQESINQILKTVINKIYFTRIFPEDIKILSTRNELRRNYPFKLEIEYIE